MSIGLGIFLIVIGAILSFALKVTVSWIDLALVGDILMIAGVIIVILGIIFMVRRRHSSVSVRHEVDPADGTRYETTDRRDDLAP